MYKLVRVSDGKLYSIQHKTDYLELLATKKFMALEQTDIAETGALKKNVKAIDPQHLDKSATAAIKSTTSKTDLKRFVAPDPTAEATGLNQENLEHYLTAYRLTKFKAAKYVTRHSSLKLEPGLNKAEVLSLYCSYLQKIQAEAEAAEEAEAAADDNSTDTEADGNASADN